MAESSLEAILQRLNQVLLSRFNGFVIDVQESATPGGEIALVASPRFGYRAAASRQV
jgi:hypothetical protein